MAYAETTTVPLDRSIAAITAMLRKAGAEQIAQFEQPGTFAIQFFLSDRMIRFRVKLPLAEDMPAYDGRHRRFTDAQRATKALQAARQRGRALMLVVKAKLESVESQVETFEQAFLANVVMSDGSTLYERLQEPIALEYRTGKVAPLMLGGPA